MRKWIDKPKHGSLHFDIKKASDWPVTHASEAVSMRLAHVAVLAGRLPAILQAARYSLSAFVVLAAGRAEAQSWKNFSAQDFPAKVRAVVFQGGVALTENHPVRLGKWSVSFGINVGAFYQIIPEINFRMILVKGLKCTNEIVGNIPCHLQLGYSTKAVPGAPWYADCSLQSDDDSYKGPNKHLPERIMDIACSIDLRLQ